MVQVGSQKYIRMLNFFLSYLVDSQIQLNRITNDHHLGYITKLGGKKEKKKNTGVDLIQGGTNFVVLK
jgi:hypothetical protein